MYFVFYGLHDTTLQICIIRLYECFVKIIKFNSCCQNKLISVSVSVSVNNVCQLNTELEPNTHQCRSEHLGE